ncbi:MAG: PQQ-dependent sugar dehydrogenase [Anaerolineales bacterium]|nr:PQQ-dependent sugar dehydrogenase [Anaerolineales bacterium]
MNRLITFLLAAVCLLAACGTNNANIAPTTDPLLEPTPEIAVDPTAEPAVEPTATAEILPEPTEEILPTPTEVMMDTPTPTAEIVPTATAEMLPTPTDVMTGTPEAGMGDMDLTVGLALVADGLTSPVGLTAAPDDSGRLFVVDQIGQIRIISADGELLAEPFLDIQDRMVALDNQYDERGLLGMAFHPNYAENGRFFLYYSAPLRADAPAGWNHTSHLSAFTVTADNPDTADPASESVLLQVDQPQGNHNAGSIAFGPDGYLYVPLGDGGAANDVAEGHVEDWYAENAGGNGQDLAQNLLGSILRIDVDAEGTNGLGYGIPEDNPFVGVAGAEEVWALGFRNPYRMSFDQGGDNALYVGDAGQDLWEEVSLVEAGGNYGWNVKEGTHCFDAANPSTSLDECPEVDADGRALIDPIIEYQNANAPGGLGLVVIGGNVYRGSALPEWDGLYVFGDWSTAFASPNGSLFVAMPPAAAGEMWTMQEVAVAGAENGRLNEYLLSFGQDSGGEIYVLTTETSGPSGNTGKVYRIVAP